MAQASPNFYDPDFDPDKDYLDDFEDDEFDDEFDDDDEEDDDDDRDNDNEREKKEKEDNKEDKKEDKEDKEKNETENDKEKNSESNETNEGPEGGEGAEGGELGETGELGEAGELGELGGEAGEIAEAAEAAEAALEATEVAVEAAETATAATEGGGAIAFLVSNPIGWAILVVIAIILVLILVGFVVSGIIGFIGSPVPTGVGGGTAPPTVVAPPTTPGSPSGVKGMIVDIALVEANLPVCGTGSQQNYGPVCKYQLYAGCACGAPWCAAFVSWVYNKAGSNIPKTCGALLSYKSMPYEYDIDVVVPQAGDIVYAPRSGGTGHVGIVWKIVGTTLYTIEGNSGTCVEKNSYRDYGRSRWTNVGSLTRY